MISTKKKRFFVELQNNKVRAIRANSAHAPVEIEDVLEISLDDATETASQVRSFAGVKGNAWLQGDCAIYPSKRLLKHLLIDTAKGKETEFVLDFLKDQVGSPEDFAAICLSAESGEEVELSASSKKPVVICGAPRQEIIDIQKGLVDLAIYPGRLELGSVSAIGALSDVASRQGDNSPLLFLEIDEEQTNAVIVGAKGVEMARSIDCGSRHIAQALKEEMNLKDEAAAEKILASTDFDLGPIAPKIMRKLMRELQSSIGFFEVQTGCSVSQLYCLKEGGRSEWLEKSISDLLNLRALEVSVSEWLSGHGVEVSEPEVASKLDMTWLGLLGMLWEPSAGKGNS